jgi:hypothetical protein
LLLCSSTGVGGQCRELLSAPSALVASAAKGEASFDLFRLLPFGEEEADAVVTVFNELCEHAQRQ